MSMIHPRQALHDSGEAPLPALTVCDHYAGDEKRIRKALALQTQLLAGRGPTFDVTGDCEDGAPVGGEAAHVLMIAELIMSQENRFDHMGARVHGYGHPSWQEEVDALVRIAGKRIAYITLPKAGNLANVQCQVNFINEAVRTHGCERSIPVHVLIETPGALNEAFAIAALPEVESLDFGLLDFISAHHGAIPPDAMVSPGQFEHPLIRRAKETIAAAALCYHRVPSHSVTTEFRDLAIVSEDARRARNEFGFLRMWSIHPDQIEPIVAAMRPGYSAVEKASEILLAAQDAQWGPIAFQGKLEDRASYRYYWQLLLRAYDTGVILGQEVLERFFSKE